MENKSFYTIKGFQKNLLESFGFSCEDDLLQKSHIEQIFEQGAENRGFTIDKKGRDIKEKLKVMLEEELQEVSLYQTKLEVLPTQIKVPPTEDSKKEWYYLLDGWEETVGPLPNCYSCEVDQLDSLSKDERILMRNYNEAIRRYIECKKEIAMLNTMLVNFEDTKIYKLTVKEASILGY